MSEPSGDAPKIIVDDDWKSQVEREKQQAAQAAQAQAAQAQAAQTPAAGSDPQPAPDKTAAPAPTAGEPAADALAAESLAADAATADALAAEAAAQTPPPATFEMLVTMLFTQAMAALGQLPGPDGKPAPINKPFAKYFIDTVELIGEKTKGNLSEEESQMLSDTLHAMRMAFVSVKAK